MTFEFIKTGMKKRKWSDGEKQTEIRYCVYLYTLSRVRAKLPAVLLSKQNRRNTIE